MPAIDRDLFVLAKERQVLANMPANMPLEMHLDDELVFNKLAEHTDYRNGQIGFDSSLSAHKIASELSESMPRKAVRNRICLDRRAVLRSIDRLVKVGLFERHTKDRKLRLVRVFYRNFMVVCQSVQNPEGRPEGTEIRNSLKILSYAIRDLHDFKKVIHSLDGTAGGIHNITNNNNKGLDKNPTVDKFSMHLDFAFDEGIVKKILQKAGFDYLKIDKRWTMSFISHYWAEGKQLNTRQWHDRYAQKMAEYLQNPGLFDELNGGALVVKPKLASVTKLPQLPKVPRVFYGVVMEKYADKHGFSKPGSRTYQQYYQDLCLERRRRLDELEGALDEN